MCNRLFTFIVFFALSTSTHFSQTKVHEVLEKLPKSNRDSALSVMPIKSYIPSKFFCNIPTSFIGISDVNVDSATAYNQAYIRALSMVALKNGLAKGMSDFYKDVNDKQISSIYEEMSELKTHSKIPLAGLKVADKFFLESGELVLFLNIDSTNVRCEERININSSIILYYKEKDTDSNGNNINKITIENKLFNSTNDNLQTEKLQTEKLTYIVSNNRWLNNETYFDNKKIETNNYKIFYEPTYDCNVDTVGFLYGGTSSVDGLWFALVNNLYCQLSAHLKNSYLKVKKVGDLYQEKMITLNRETGYFRFGCSLTNAILIDNKLLTNIRVNYP